MLRNLVRPAHLRLAVALAAIGLAVRASGEPRPLPSGPARASGEPRPVGAQTARDHLSIGTHTTSTARACRPYELRYPRPSNPPPSQPDLWWELGRSDNHADIALDPPFVARRIALDLYGWFRGDRTLCQGTIDVVINGGPARAVGVESGCTGRREENFQRTVTLDLARPTPITTIRLIDRVAQHDPRPGFILLERVTLSATTSAPPAVATVVDVWAEVHDVPPGIPGPGLWAMRPGKPARAIAGPLPSDPGNEVWVWPARGSSRVFLAELAGAPRPPREIYALDAATEDRLRLVARFDRDIVDAWYDECLDALIVELADHTTRQVSADRPPSPTTRD